MNRKIIVIIICLAVLVSLVFGIVLFANIKNKKVNQEENIIDNMSYDELEENFQKSFSQIKDMQANKDGVSTQYVLEKNKENRYSIGVFLPQINSKTRVTKKINEEILDTYGKTILTILKNDGKYISYNVNYTTYKNENIISIIIKTVLKDGNNPQRVIIQTYNYDEVEDKLVTLEEILEQKNIEKTDVQSKIIDTIREKNTNSSTLANQGYNVFVRDIRSDEYLVQNIETFFIGENGHIFIVFSYGNNAYTTTMDVIIL